MHGVTLARNASAHSLSWLVRHNPFYLLSALLVATGARMHLVGPTDAAGDLQLILMTLCVLQVYEWAVSAVLIALHRSGRSPEDVPVIMLVGAIFWTGPMAATIELSALDPISGLGLAIGASIIAFAEFRATLRMLWIRVSIRAQLVCAACLTLLTAIGPLMHIDDRGASANEILFYAAWWVLALLPIGLLGCGYGPSRATMHDDDRKTRIAANGVFAAVVIVMTAVNFVGVGHAFLCQTRWFYASPLIIAFAVLLLHALPSNTRTARVLVTVIAFLPAAAIAISFRGFAPDFPTDQLPMLLRDPTVAIAMAAAMAYGAGYFWRRHVGFVHAMFASVAVAALAAYKSVVLGDVELQVLFADDYLRRLVISVGLYAAAGYLLVCAIVRHSRSELLTCIATQFSATVSLTWGRFDDAHVLIFLCFGWSMLAAIHVGTNRPRLIYRLIPITFIALATVYWGAGDHRVEAALHALVMVALLLAVGIVWRWTRYVTISLSLAGAFGAMFGVTEAVNGPAPIAALVSAAGFAALFLGAALSWHKARLIEALQRLSVVGAAVDTESEPGLE